MDSVFKVADALNVRPEPKSSARGGVLPRKVPRVLPISTQTSATGEAVSMQAVPEGPCGVPCVLTRRPQTRRVNTCHLFASWHF